LSEPVVDRISISTLLLVDRPMRPIRSTIERGGCAPLNAD
jgi:hypothetical protein